MSSVESDSVLRFRRALDALKRDGGAILVVGETPRGAHRALCDRMLGHGDGEYRRIFVDTDADCTAPSGGHVTEPSTYRVLEYVADTRSVTTTATASDGPGVTDAYHSFDALADALQRVIHAAVNSVDDPARLRVCIDSLLPLLSDHDRQRVFRFLHPLCADLRELGGMGHCHLPVAREAELVRLFRPLFDAVIELRIHDGITQHRWNLVERDIESEWLSVTRS